jgi:Rps23 Pro-64 3,4-dihydroxylase Tpa1-like proline 4-hydroxylase
MGEHPESILKDGCIPGAERCFDLPEENKKSSINTDERMGTYTRILFSFLKSNTFTKFLEDLSGIPNLLPDPHFRGSGLHFTATGGSLDIHADFNRHPGNNLDRCVNVFIYLNDHWPEEYGGHLELWSKDMQSCYQRIQPKLHNPDLRSINDIKDTLVS